MRTTAQSTASRRFRLLAPRSRRRVSVVAGVVLLIVCGAATFGSYRVHRAVDSAQQSSSLADAYQDARYQAAREDGQLMQYRVDQDRAAQVQFTEASAALDASLGQIRAEDPSPSRPDGVLAVRIWHDQVHYKRLAHQELRLLNRGHGNVANRFDHGVVDPVFGALTASLDQAEERHHDAEVASLARADRDGRLLQIGTPLGLALALIVLGAFVASSRSYRRRIQRQALHDALTGLPNRLLFNDRVSHTLTAARRSGADPAVMMIDLDGFKDINDTLGHHCGDQLLIDVGQRLRTALRAGDTVARLGADEFAVLLADGGLAGGVEVATRLLAALEEPFQLQGITVGVEASIGVATASSESDPEAPDTGQGHAGRMADLLQHADSAMYQAKKNRRGFDTYAPGQVDESPRHITLLGELRQALERDELVLHYQPKVRVDTGEFLGVEALVRWQHPSRGLIGPNEFIGLAESTTLIHRLSAVVLDKALSFSRDWLDRGVAVPVAVNVSARTLLDPSLASTIAAKLRDADVPAHLLCLELTESAIMADPDGALAILRALHDMGVRLSVDDFGTGYSSMAYLKLLPVDELKVDRSFVSEMTTDPSDTVLVQSAIDLGHNLGMLVVAEGVENSETLAALHAVGADVAQGYHLGRPMPGDQLAVWLTGHTSALSHR